MVTDFNQTYRGNHFAMYTDMESPWCTPETITMLCVNYTSIEKRNTGNPSGRKKMILCGYV